MSKAGKLNRGAKWNALMEKAEFEEDNATVESMKSQASIMEDIQFYLESTGKKTSSEEPTEPDEPEPGEPKKKKGFKKRV